MNIFFVSIVVQSISLSLPSPGTLTLIHFPDTESAFGTHSRSETERVHTSVQLMSLNHIYQGHHLTTDSVYGHIHHFPLMEDSHTGNAFLITT